MGNLIDSITTAIGVGVLGYFAYVVLLPQMKQILQDMPPLLPSSSLFPPMQPQVAPAPLPPISEPPVQDLIDDALDDDPLTRADDTPAPKTAPRKAPLPSSNNTPSSSAPPAAGGGGGGPVGKGLTPEALGMKSTGKKVTMLQGKDTAGNGMRYNVNHTFQNYVMIGLYKLGSGQELIEMKTDGPNHSGCTSLPRCFWAEPRFEMSGGKATLSFEGPHGSGDKGHVVSCPSCKSIPGSYTGGKTIGYAVAAYGPKGNRIVEQWVDPTGTGNSWQLTLREKIDSRFGAGNVSRDLPVDGRGMEAEIRMHGASSGTAMQNSFVYEIVSPTTAAAGFAQSLFTFLEAKTPRRYNRRRWVS